MAESQRMGAPQPAMPPEWVGARAGRRRGGFGRRTARRGWALVRALLPRGVHRPARRAHHRHDLRCAGDRDQRQAAVTDAVEQCHEHCHERCRDPGGGARSARVRRRPRPRAARRPAPRAGRRSRSSRARRRPRRARARVAGGRVRSRGPTRPSTPSPRSDAAPPRSHPRSSTAGDVVGPLVTLLADRDVTVVEAAAWALGELGDHAVDGHAVDALADDRSHAPRSARAGSRGRGPRRARRSRGSRRDPARVQRSSRGATTRGARARAVLGPGSRRRDRGRARRPRLAGPPGGGGSRSVVAGHRLGVDRELALRADPLGPDVTVPVAVLETREGIGVPPRATRPDALLDHERSAWWAPASTVLPTVLPGAADLRAARRSRARTRSRARSSRRRSASRCRPRCVDVASTRMIATIGHDGADDVRDPPRGHERRPGPRPPLRAPARDCSSELRHRSWNTRYGITRLANGINQPAIPHPGEMRSPSRPSAFGRWSGCATAR